MALKEGLSQDIINCFLNTDEFAETIIYAPKGGVSKDIKAIVNRRRIEPAAEDSSRTLYREVEIIIANDPIYGVSSVNKGQDEVSLSEVIGGPAISWVVVDIMNQDEGAWQLLLQK
jgi:hypothetical protein